MRFGASDRVYLSSLTPGLKQAIIKHARGVPMLSKGPAHNMFGDYYVSFDWLLNEVVKEGIGMVLYPDMSRDQYTANDTFVWGGPIDTVTFMALEVISQKGLSDAHPRWAIHDGTGVVLRHAQHSDDDCLVTAAWMRQMCDFDGRIYACEPSDHVTVNAVIHRAAGAPRDLVALLSDPE